MNESCKDGVHEKVVLDKFARDFKGSRRMPGDCYCLDCSSALPFLWNNGKPIPVEKKAA